MPSRITDEDFGHTVLQSVQHGAYPEDDQIVAAELPSSALPQLSTLLEKARFDAKENIRKLSKESAPDIDGWVVQARQLRRDIESTQERSREIVARAQDGDRLQANAQDALGKVHLLNREVEFNEGLAGVLGQIYKIRHALEETQQAATAGRLSDAVEGLLYTRFQVQELPAWRNSRIAELLRSEIAGLGHLVGDALSECWEGLVLVERQSSTVTIRNQKSRVSPVDISTVITSLDKLELKQEKINQLRWDFEKVIVRPRLQIQADGTVASLLIQENSLHLSGRTPNVTLKLLFSDLESIIKYLNSHLPWSVTGSLSELLMPGIISRLVSGWLVHSTPSDLQGLQEFEALLYQVSSFASLLNDLKWPGKNDLEFWVKRAPQVWLTKKRDGSLDTVRQLLGQGFGEVRTVERVETQEVTGEDGMFRGNSTEGDWNSEWSDDEGKEETRALDQQQKATVPSGADEEDVSAWGLDDEPDNNSSTVTSRPITTDEDDTDAWGWGDDNENMNSAPSPVHDEAHPTSQSNGMPPARQQSKREVTLKESYNITALPEQLLEIVSQVVSDADSLTQSRYASSPIASAADSLFSLPGSILSIYRAIAPTFYARNASGSMFLYNDSLWMSERLQILAQDHASRQRTQDLRATRKLNLDYDVAALALFGKRAYAREMESQRTILGDLLDGSQGFANCTTPPFAQECDIAIDSVVDRIRDIYKEWKPVLSHSALLQSIGSLLSTVLDKVILDVEDMSDISEPESQRLASFCNRLASLEDLFMPMQSQETTSNSEQAVPLTAIYAATWLKFQYLSNILESSLVDIKYLWTEGELRLEFSAEELVDLIEALFADSEHRRRAIGEIRRS